MNLMAFGKKKTHILFLGTNIRCLLVTSPFPTGVLSTQASYTFTLILLQETTLCKEFTNQCDFDFYLNDISCSS